MSLGENPFLVFNDWFNAAEKAGVTEPNAMVLSSLGADQMPASRVVLLKDVQDEVFYFFTNYNSTKSQEMLKNPRVAINFHWRLPFHRQIRIQGQVQKATAEISDEYFSTRPRGSQIGAWSSPQSQKITGRQQIEDIVKTFEKKFEGQTVPRPEFWGGFGITASSFEFWQEGEFRLHTRWKYTKSAQGWKSELLAP